MSEYGHVFRGMIFPHPALILTKGHVKGPVQTVFNAPVAPDGRRHLFGADFDTGDVIGGFGADVAADIAVALDFHDGFKARPVLFALQLGDITAQPIPTGFDPSMAAIDGFKLWPR